MEFNFEYDWFSGNIPNFQAHLSEFSDKPVLGLEIGTHEGRSTTWMLKNILRHDMGRLICIDIYEQRVLRANLAATGAGHKVDLRIGHSFEMLHPFSPNSFDFAYIDGSHWACDVLEDAVMTFRRVKVGGVIGFDDYEWDDPQFNQHGKPKPAIDAFLECYQHKIAVLSKGFQVWIRKIAN